jgi:hypothetical protein
MTAWQSPGVIELSAQYNAFARPSTMVFYFRTPTYGAPTAADCKALAEQYGLWENNGFAIGYALIRSDRSNFVRANTRSRDFFSQAGFTDTPFERPGLTPSRIAPMLSSSSSPIVNWLQDSSRRMYRTYAVGLASIFVIPLEDDVTYVGSGPAGNVQAPFDALRTEIQAGCGLIQVAMETRRAGALLVPALAHDVVGCTVHAQQVGSQRRRTRPG